MKILKKLLKKRKTQRSDSILNGIINKSVESTKKIEEQISELTKVKERLDQLEKNIVKGKRNSKTKGKNLHRIQKRRSVLNQEIKQLNVNLGESEQREFVGNLIYVLREKYGESTTTKHLIEARSRSEIKRTT